MLATRPDMTEEYDLYPTAYDGLPPLLHLVGGAERGNDLAYGQTIAFPEHSGRPAGVLYVEGADHYSWTDSATTTHTKVPREQVLIVAEPAMISFLALTVEGLTEGADPWRGDTTPPWIDRIELRSQWRDPSARVIDSFEEDGKGLDTPRSNEGFETVEELWAFDEDRHLYSTTMALELAWTDNTSSVSWDVGETDLSETPVLSLRLLAVHDDPLNPDSTTLDLEVELEDADGDVGSWSLSDSPQGALRPTPYWLETTTPKSVFETWRIPLRRMADLHPGLDLDRIARVHLRPISATGRVLLDDLEWSEGEGCW